jgi:hypothetical protein
MSRDPDPTTATSGRLIAEEGSAAYSAMSFRTSCLGVPSGKKRGWESTRLLVGAGQSSRPKSFMKITPTMNAIRQPTIANAHTPKTGSRESMGRA